MVVSIGNCSRAARSNRPHHRIKTQARALTAVWACAVVNVHHSIVLMCC